MNSRFTSGGCANSTPHIRGSQDRHTCRDVITATMRPAARSEHMETAAGLGVERMLRMLQDALPVVADGRPATARIPTPAHIQSLGVAAITESVWHAASGFTLTDLQVAWLAGLLLIPSVCDHAWKISDGSDAHLELWTQVSSRAVASTTAAPSTLLAMNAYLAGDDRLAAVALDCALLAEPRYRPANLLQAAIEQLSTGSAQLR